MNISKILKIVSAVIALIAIYFFIKVAGGEEGSEALSGDVSATIAFTKAILIGVMLLIVVFMVLDIIKNPKNLKKTIIGLALFGVIFVIAYVLAGSEEVIASAGKKVLAEKGSSLSKNVSTGIVMSAILGIIAFGGFIFDSVKSLLK